MADETMQTEEETSWWAFDAFADSDLPSTSFDEPLEWPGTLEWGDFAAGEGDLQFPAIDDLASAPLFPEGPGAALPAAAAPAPPEAQPHADDATMPHVTVLSGLGGGAPGPAVPAGDHASAERLPDSVWAPDPAAGNGNGNGHASGAPVVSTTPLAAPTFYAGAGAGGGGWQRRFDLRHGNAAVIALISFVSLVLLGMFMSVRARNDVLDTSQTRTTSDQISVQAPLNTIPLTTTATTVAPPPINIADLLPPPEDATTVTDGAGAGAGGSGGSGGTSATTAAPARSAPTGGGTGTTQPPAQPAATAAPQTTAPPDTAPPPTSPTVEQTTPSSIPRRTPTFPNMSPTVPANDGPTYTIPSIPGFPGFPGNNN
ncbi:MAG TPA: hypothetical protein VM388_06895 [Acidimicrobiales bacterium]|nr:hypothetical protein [Acidimicrobiales bacterium]